MGPPRAQGAQDNGIVATRPGATAMARFGIPSLACLMILGPASGRLGRRSEIRFAELELRGPGQQLAWSRSAM